MNVSQILSENAKRVAELKADDAEYNQHTGVRCCGTRFAIPISSRLVLHVPVSMKHHPLAVGISMFGSLDAMVDQVAIRNSSYTTEQLYELKAQALDEFSKERLRHDFEYWSITCATVQDKITKNPVKFKLRRPQRKMLAVLVDMVERKVPIRIILLKARQWGGSTLVQIFMIWVQVHHRDGWHSVIVGDVENQARIIRAMINRVIKYFPISIGSISIAPFEGSGKNKYLKYVSKFEFTKNDEGEEKPIERTSIISIGSMQQPESLRATDIVMAHKSEVGLWKETLGKKPEDLAQAIAGTIPFVPLSLDIEESTAKGIGNYFHRRWLAAKRGENGYTPVFIPWFDIDMYSLNFDTEEEKRLFASSLTEKENIRFEQGATLEGLKWYRMKLAEMEGNTWRMEAEFPSDDVEAFQSTGQRVYSPIYLSRMRKTCRKPSFVGDIYGDATHGPDCLKNIRFDESGTGNFAIWVKPDAGKWKNRYVVVIDFCKGHSEHADYCSIRVIDRYWVSEGGVPEAIATWHGRLDPDQAAWKGAQIAKWFSDALLVVESNTLETGSTMMDDNHFITVMDEIKDYYENIYARTDPQRIVEGVPVRYGFHTNKSTKQAIVNFNIKTYREGGYVEYDERAIDEADTYEKKPNGSYGAVEGCHDDNHMSTSIGLYVADSLPNPVEIKQKTASSSSKPRRSATESSF